MLFFLSGKNKLQILLLLALVVVFPVLVLRQSYTMFLTRGEARNKVDGTPRWRFNNNMLYSRKQGYDGTSFIYQHYNKHGFRDNKLSDNLVDVTFYTQNTLEAVKTASRVF